MKPTIDVILQTFFTERLEGTSGVTRSRILAVDRALRACLEEAGTRILTTGDLTLLALERAIDPLDAFARTMHADDLVFVLPMFVEDPYLLRDRLERKAQLQITAALSRFILARRLVNESDLACPIYDLQYALRQARNQLAEVDTETSKQG